ncbi:DNA alkylation repair protein [Methanosphaerula palustris]|uniref:DNA alkylation repair enzyme n=1 Tax=Methanosphaerula palustris (strain ATCC BAA-1556 / DSM 19958 / E1-9c) TaxID=521011 RepID=B8GJF2_METPE|nr:DNA alkylation repair protein [Methanosphaerula palustris]ACL16993.1 DNA alkylation repair enzyme [Methanosphaerula palustris E1-9c]
METVLERIRTDLKNSCDPTTQKNFQRFFKEEVRYYGVKTPTVGKIAKRYWSEIKSQNKQEIFNLCDELYRSDYTEEAFIVSNWVPNLADRYEITDLAVFQVWIEKYINNWAKCDGFCNHTLGTFIMMYPECIEKLKKWTQSDNRWLKRAAAVSLILPAKQGEFLDDIFEIADRLLTDREDLVQKGYGWLLKEASRHHQDEVYLYVLKNRSTMPRTALRYAIELMPLKRRKEAMKRG